MAPPSPVVDDPAGGPRAPTTRPNGEVPDRPVHDHAAAKRGWAEMLATFERTLRGSTPT